MCIPSFGSHSDLTISTTAAASPEVWRSKPSKSTSSTHSDDARSRLIKSMYIRRTVVVMYFIPTSSSAVQSSDMKVCLINSRDAGMHCVAKQADVALFDNRRC